MSADSLAPGYHFQPVGMEDPSSRDGERPGKGSQLSVGVIIGITVGVVIGLVLASCVLLILRLRKRARARGGSRGLTSDQKDLALPIRVNGMNSSVVLSHVNSKELPPQPKEQSLFGFLFGGNNNKTYLPSVSAVTRFSYKDLQKSTNNFTALIGRGAFGSVYKAIEPSGNILAVKILCTDSKQGEKEFDTEVTLLARLHHRNLVNLVGYCADRAERMLVYEYMSNGSLAGFLYDPETEPLSWERRVHIAQDVSRGIEYLHEGASPPVIHRDIKSHNILLDGSMTARVADFGLSKVKEGPPDSAISGVKGTFGYVDPEYVLTNAFTEKSDVYSFGVLLFELITGRNPQQGLMDYVHLAAMGVEGKNGWGELLDPRLNGQCDPEALGSMASIAYKCVQRLPKARPRMRTVAQALSKLGRRRYNEVPRPANLAPVPEGSEEFVPGDSLHQGHQDSSNYKE